MIIDHLKWAHQQWNSRIVYKKIMAWFHFRVCTSSLLIKLLLYHMFSHIFIYSFLFLNRVSSARNCGHQTLSFNAATCSRLDLNIWSWLNWKRLVSSHLNVLWYIFIYLFICSLIYLRKYIFWRSPCKIKHALVLITVTNIPTNKYPIR